MAQITEAKNLIEEADRIARQASSGTESDAMAVIAIAILKVGAALVNKCDEIIDSLERPSLPEPPTIDV